ncbi:hypothetical protein ACHAWO_010842 [Cyclotella atomus]|uniref:Uncharacterized protein n=1 Tax=Cyclotella atomus TaxID=382360 RepID=A0ABD3QCI6_9STRA
MSDNNKIEEQTSADAELPAVEQPDQAEDSMSAPTESAAPQTPRYRSIFVNFMSHFHQKSTPYPQDQDFTDEGFLAVTPHHVCVYLNVKAFGKPKPEDHDKLILNFTGVDFIRKAIEYYMPHENNPARSNEVLSLMDKIRSLESDTKAGRVAPILPQDSLVDPEDTHDASLESDNAVTTDLLRTMHNRNVQFLSVIQAMDSTIRTLTKTVHQMRRTLESNNLQISDEISASDCLANGVPLIDHSATTSIVKRLKAEEAGITAALNNLAKNEYPSVLPVPTGNASMKVDAQGHCTFYNEMGKEMDLPEGFELPTCDLIDAWTAWLTGFPTHKFRVTKTTEEGETESLVDAPIKPLRNMKLGCIPASLKKKYKDGWRPILQYMATSVDNMIAGVPPADMDDSFINATFNAAMEALIIKVPAMFQGKNERSKTWKVATWSRKIREQTGSQRRSLEEVKDEDAENLADVAMAEMV